MLAGGTVGQVIPQVHILADGAVDTADVAHQLTIQEHPQVIVAEEGVLQRAHIIFRQRKAEGEVHAEEPVVGPSIVTVREVMIRCYSIKILWYPIFSP